MPASAFADKPADEIAFASRVARAGRRLALMALLAGLPLAARATADLAVPAVVCVPANTQTMNAENKPLTLGVVRQSAGRSTPPRAYFCPVFNPDITAAVQPSWRYLRMTYADSSGSSGNAVLRLFAKSRAKTPGDPPLGTTLALAQVSSVPSVGVAVVSTALPVVLDFHRFSYWFVLDLQAFTGTTTQVDVHELQLTD